MQELEDRSELRRIRITEIGWFYQIPFRFEVTPDQRKLAECQAHLRGTVRKVQLKLPPSYEKKSVTSMAPNIVLSSYCITAKLLRDDMANPLAETWRVIRIVPIVRENPPLLGNILGKERLATGKIYLEGKAWTGSQRKMEMEAAQPRSLCLPITTGYDSCEKESVETRSEVKLRFEPMEVNGIAPKLRRITAKLRAATRVSSSLMLDCPYRVGDRADGTEDGPSVETITLDWGTVQEVKWQWDLAGPKREKGSSDQR